MELLEYESGPWITALSYSFTNLDEAVLFAEIIGNDFEDNEDFKVELRETHTYNLVEQTKGK